MTDLSQMSDAELVALYQQEKAKADRGFIAPPRAAPDKIAARSDYTSAVGDLRKQREQWASLQPLVGSLDRFEQLNQKQPTGSWLRQVPGINDFTAAQDPELSAMQSISSTLQTRGVPSGQGQISNYERELFARGSPSIKTLGPVNEDIVNYQRATYAQQGDRLEFMDAYLAQNGSLNGAQEAWNNYVKANPYVAEDGERVRLNDKRQPWRTYFGVAPPAPQGQYSPEQAKVLAPIQQALKSAPQKAARGSLANPYVVTDHNQVATVPKGAIYLGPDGLFRRNDNGTKGNPIVGAPSAKPPATAPRKAAAPKPGAVLTYNPSTGEFE